MAFVRLGLMVTVSGAGVGVGVGPCGVSLGRYRDWTITFVSAIAFCRAWICARCWSCMDCICCCCWVMKFCIQSGIWASGCVIMLKSLCGPGAEPVPATVSSSSLLFLRRWSRGWACSCNLMRNGQRGPPCAVRGAECRLRRSAKRPGAEPNPAAE